MMTAEEYQKIEDQIEIVRVRHGLKTIERLNRRGLLRLLDRDSDRANTARLRSKVRLLFLANTITELDVARAAKQ